MYVFEYNSQSIHIDNVYTTVNGSCEFSEIVSQEPLP